MGNTFKTGNYVNGIFQDTSNNIGIGAAPSGTYKFEITGTSKVSGVLTLGSTLSNGTYTYTLPAATGTLALVGGAGVGTVTSVAALTIGTTGTDLSSSVATSTTTPVITLNVPTASATNRGALSSADWTTFNNKQGTLTLTTTGTSGAATFSANTLNIPQYQGVLTNPVTGTGTTNYLPKFTGTSTIGNSVIQESSNLIGIGMTPFSGYKLNVSGLQKNEGANTTLNFGELDANNIYFQALNLAGNASKGFVWYGTGEYMRIWSSTGNVNIGTTPASDSGYKLDVNGTGRFSGNLGLSTLQTWSSGQVVLQVSNASLYNNGASNSYFGNNYYLNSGGSVTYLTTSSVGVLGQEGNSLVYYNAPSGTAGTTVSLTERFRIASTGAATFSSSVTAGALSRIGDVYIGGFAGTYVTYLDGVFGNNLHLGATGASGAVYINTALSRNIIMNPVGGNVLIGTTTDDTINKLQVSGGIYSSNYNTNFNSVTINSSTNVNTAVLDIGIVCFRDAVNGGGCLVFYENGQTPVIVSQSGGTTFTTSSPSATEIQISNRSGSRGLQALGGSSRNSVQLIWSVFRITGLSA